MIDGKQRKLHPRSYCLSCSPWGQGNNKQLEKVRTDGLRTCSDCRKDHPTTSYGPRDGRCKACCAKRASLKRHQIKKQCVDYLGGACVRCGYSRCMAALDFHHRDPSEKEFEIGHGPKRSLNNLKTELDKCDLLCRNCHAEHHFASL